MGSGLGLVVLAWGLALVRDLLWFLVLWCGAIQVLGVWVCWCWGSLGGLGVSGWSGGIGVW